MRKLYLSLMAMFLAVAAWFTVQAADNGVRATAPTTYTDGTALNGDLTSMRVYRTIVAAGAPCPTAVASYSVIATSPYSTAGGAFTYLDQSLTQSGRYCYRMTALTANGAESALSTSIGFKDVDLRVPNSPTSISVI